MHGSGGRAEVGGRNEGRYRRSTRISIGVSGRSVAAIAEVESVAAFTLVPIDAGSFYAYARQITREADRRFRSAFAHRHLFVIPPVEYTSDGHMRFTVVGESADFQALVDNFPKRISATVEEIGEYDRRHGTVAGALTDELDCAESTASTPLRKAESKVMGRVVGE